MKHVSGKIVFLQQELGGKWSEVEEGDNLIFRGDFDTKYAMKLIAELEKMGITAIAKGTESATIELDTNQFLKVWIQSSLRSFSDGTIHQEIQKSLETGRGGRT